MVFSRESAKKPPGISRPLPGVHWKTPGKSLGYTRASPWGFPRNSCKDLGKTTPTLGKLVEVPLENIAKLLGEAWPILGGLLRQVSWQVLQSARETIFLFANGMRNFSAKTERLASTGSMISKNGASRRGAVLIFEIRGCQTRPLTAFPSLSIYIYTHTRPCSPNSRRQICPLCP